MDTKWGLTLALYLYGKSNLMPKVLKLLEFEKKKKTNM